MTTPACGNYLNQVAIDAAARDENRKLGGKLYPEGVNVCLECRDGGHPDPIGSLVLPNGTHRICFKKKLEVF